MKKAKTTKPQASTKQAEKPKKGVKVQRLTIDDLEVADVKAGLMAGDTNCQRNTQC